MLLAATLVSAQLASDNTRTAAAGSAVSFSGEALASAVEAAISGEIHFLLKSSNEDNAAHNLFQFASARTTGGYPGLKLMIDYSLPDAIEPAIVPPTVPADDATGVLVTTSLVATFDELIALEDGGTVANFFCPGLRTAL